MTRALYEPDLGFYATPRAGRRGDFITSPEVGPLYGRLVARAIDRWWAELDRPAAFDFVEVGAGPGTLARTVLRSPMECREALRYAAVEWSEAQRDRHPPGVDSRSTAPTAVNGVVFANELLDNLPFDLYEFDPTRGWREVKVDAAADGGLTEILVDGDPPIDGLAAPSGPCRVPVTTGACAWLVGALARVESGLVVMVDYAVDGYPVGPDRTWLRTFRGHERGTHPLDRPGSQDITIDVDLHQLASIRPPDSVVTQAHWLRTLGIEDLVADGRRQWGEDAARPGLAAIEGRSRVSEAEALLDPEGLGGFAVVEWRV